MYKRQALQSLYTEYGEKLGDVVFLGIDAPKSDLNPFSQEGSKEEVIAFLDENQYTFPTVFDETGEVTAAYYINGFPTTFFIDQEGNVALYAPGRLPEDTLRQVIRYVAGEIDSIYPTE